MPNPYLSEKLAQAHHEDRLREAEQRRLLAQLPEPGRSRHIHPVQFVSFLRALRVGTLSVKLVLTRECREGKLEKEDLRRKGKDHAKDPANLYPRVQGRSGATCTVESETVDSNRPRPGHCGQYAASLVSTVFRAWRASLSRQWASNSEGVRNSGVSNGSLISCVRSATS